MKTLEAIYEAERKEACRGGHHKFVTWKTDDEGRLYWDCAYGCGHRHRRDPVTEEEAAAEANCASYERERQIAAKRASRKDAN
ncbi:hypothetical protein [Actinomadura violacea]|uniref:Uncharacterized protein n=1 Tax=Actinomadura violacea TaxID=2819934 RepID=A0ABS3RSX9_9ACTN|nr:hypothetical protein [Actinomadura violacea]MBO2459837.1 hypothetical protein [Actinomadura violacea]